MPIWKSNRKNLYVMWHHGKWYQKILFIMQPFLQDVIFVWLDVWNATPLPAMIKFILTVIMIEIMLLPAVLALVGIGVYLGFWQYQINSLYPSMFPIQMQTFYWIQQIFKRTEYSTSQVEYFQTRVQSFLYLTAGMFDYMRLIMELF